MSKKSGFARGCRPSACSSSAPVMALAPRAVNSPSSTAESSVLAGQNAIPTSMMRAGVNGSDTISSFARSLDSSYAIYGELPSR